MASRQGFSGMVTAGGSRIPHEAALSPAGSTTIVDLAITAKLETVAGCAGACFDFCELVSTHDCALGITKKGAGRTNAAYIRG